YHPQRDHAHVLIRGDGRRVRGHDHLRGGLLRIDPIGDYAYQVTFGDDADQSAIGHDGYGIGIFESHLARHFRETGPWVDCEQAPRWQIPHFHVHSTSWLIGTIRCELFGGRL